MAPTENIQSEPYQYFDKYNPAHAITDTKPKLQIVWKNVIFLSMLHIGALPGFYLFFIRAMWITRIYLVCFVMPLAGFGVTAGAHRLWSHKSYKAKLPLRILLVIMNTMAMQNSAIVWARDHRIHHTYSETDADPHNSRRGFFFSHMGWLLVKKHPDVKAKGKNIDMSDLWSDPLLRFQYKYYFLLSFIIGVAVPIYIPTLWGERLDVAILACGIFRYVYTLHGTWLVNSAAHMWGMKPYDKHINPVENLTVSVIALGEGFHNYHHTFPWDYKTAELGNYSHNMTTLFIDAMAKIGWAYDLKTVSPEVIEKRIKRTGDNSHKIHGHEEIPYE